MKNRKSVNVPSLETIPQQCLVHFSKLQSFDTTVKQHHITNTAQPSGQENWGNRQEVWTVFFPVTVDSTPTLGSKHTLLHT